MKHHRLQKRLGDIVKASQSNVQHPFPIRFGHQGEDVVTPDAGIVHQHLDIVVGVRLSPRFEDGTGFRTVAYVELQEFALLPGFADKRECLFGFCRVACIVDKDVIPHLCQLDTDGTADTSASAGH